MNKEKDNAFLYADDLVKDGKFAEFVLEIAEVVAVGGITYANKRQTSKPTLRFKETPKCWELPKTQERLLSLMLGKDQAKWPGTKVTLHAALTNSPQGDGECPAVRIRPTVRAAMIPIGVRSWFGKDLTGTPINQV